MRDRIGMHLSGLISETKDAFSVQEIMEALEVPEEDILLVKNGLEELVDAKLVERKIARGKPWYRWKIEEQ